MSLTGPERSYPRARVNSTYLILHRSRKRDLDGFVVFFLFFFFHHTYWSTFYPVSVEVLQDGRGTDVKKQNKSIIDADGFILVSGKKLHTGGYANDAVAARSSQDEKSKIVSRSLS